MPTAIPRQTTSRAAAPGAESKATAPNHGVECYGEIVALARSVPSVQAYFRGVLRAVTHSAHSPYGAIYVRLASEVIQDDCPAGAGDPDFWRTKLQSFLTDSLSEHGTRARVLRAKQSGSRIAFVAAPVFGSGDGQIGALALVLAPFEDEAVAAKLSWLESLTRLASYAAEFVNASAPAGAAASSGGPNQALARAASYTTPTEVAFSITNSLRNKLGCTQVALGMAARRRVKILSISGLDHVAKQGDGVSRLQAAMEECYDAARTLVHHPKQSWTADGVGTDYRLHQQWSAATKGDAVASIPLKANGKVVAVLSLRQSANESLTPELLENLRSRVEPFAAALVLAHRACRSVPAHALDRAHEAAAALVGPGRRNTKLLTALAAVALGWFAFGKVDYQLTVPCSVVPAQVRHVTAPFDGVLESAAALQGDRVSRGDVLCEMERRDLAQQRAQLLAEIAVLEHEQDRAMAASTPVDAQLALAQQRLARARLDIVESRLAQASVRSPIDGVIAVGDLRKRTGAVVSRGEALFEVAPLDKWILELRVPEADGDELRAELAGAFVPEARPEESQTFRISRVRPQAEVQNEENVYIAEADTHLPYDWMRPGMEGIAKVNVGRRPVWWVALHRAVEYVQLHLWP